MKEKRTNNNVMLYYMHSQSISNDNNTQQKQNKTLKIHAVHKQLVTENNIHNFPYRIIIIGKKQSRDRARKRAKKEKQEI